MTNSIHQDISAPPMTASTVSYINQELLSAIACAAVIVVKPISRGHQCFSIEACLKHFHTFSIALCVDSHPRQVPLRGAVGSFLLWHCAHILFPHSEAQPHTPFTRTSSTALMSATGMLLRDSSGNRAYSNETALKVITKSLSVIITKWLVVVKRSGMVILGN